jgi:glucose-1-phosphate adenylyltransferase
MNYAELIEFHRSNGADITLGVYPVSREEAPRMGLIKVNSEGYVDRIVEKPLEDEIINQFKAPGQIGKTRIASNDSERFLASMGIYVFNSDILDASLSNSGHYDFGGEIIPAAVSEYKVLAYPFMGYWKDIGTISSYFEANISLAQPDPPFALYEPRWPFYTHTRSLPPSRLIHSEVRDSLVVEGSSITGARITDSIVGVRSVIQDGSSLTEVVMSGADFYENEQVLGNDDKENQLLPALGIGNGCVIERAIIDKNVRIGDNVKINPKSGIKEYQGELYWVRDGITIIPKGTVIPDGTKL